MDKRWLVLVAAAAAIGLGFWLRGRSVARAGSASVAAATPGDGAPLSDGANNAVIGERSGAVGRASAAPQEGEARASALPALAEARGRADAARTRIATSKSYVGGASALKGSATAAPAEPPSMPAPVGSGNQATQPLGQYVKEMLSEQFFPMGAACYEQFTSRGSQLRGRIVLDVTIVGDRSVGGVVDEVVIRPESTIKVGELASCVRESMMAMMFRPPPDDSGKVTFTLPLDFAPEAPPTEAKPGTPGKP